MKELRIIQEKLNVPKRKSSKSVKIKFSYRSCDDILEAVKPLLKETNTILTISDEVVKIGDRYYVKATAILSAAGEKEEWVGVSAYAREVEERVGMDGSQITGSASSYARKYALGGLFAIDDGEDADSMANGTKTVAKTTKTVISTKSKTETPNKKASTLQVNYLRRLGYKGDVWKLTSKEANKMIKLLKEKNEQKDE